MIKKYLPGDNCSKWVFFLAVFSFFVVDAVFRVRDYSDKSVDFQVLIKIASMLLVLLYSIFNLKYFFCGPRRLLSMASGFFLLYLFISVFWSENVFYGLVGAFSLVSYFMFIAVCVRKYGVKFFLDSFLLSATLFFICSFFAYLFIPELGRISYWEYSTYVEGGRMSGIAGSANNLGRYACFALLISFYAYICGDRGALVKFVAICSVIALALSLNRSSMLMAAIGILGITHTRSRNFSYLVVLISFFIAILFFLILQVDLRIFSRSGELDELLTFTGRTSIWSVVIDLIADNPVFGYGYGSGVFLLSQYVDEIGFSPSHSHNLFLQILLYGGAVGLMVFLFLILSIIYQAREYKRLCLVLVLYVLYNGLLESGAFSGLVNITSIAFFLSVFLSELDSNDFEYNRRLS